MEAEQKLIRGMNILICTPGRLLHHLQETIDFEYGNLKMLIIDEADEILSMGFINTVHQIIKCLPKNRQTILLSATLNSKVLQLSKLAMRVNRWSDKNPEKILLNDVKLAGKPSEEATSMLEKYATPKQLKQYCMLMDYDEKIDNLFSFLKSHQKSKILVFLTSCKQVRFVYNAFKLLKPGMPVLELHGRQKQPKRMAIYFTFSERKFSCLFTTSVSARGLDFPAVDWVVQMDCPDNVENYVHKIGRTARYNSKGKSMLFLAYEEAKFLDKLKDATINVHKLKVNPERLLTIKSTLQSLCTENQELKYLGQRAIISYLKSINYLPDKEIFNVKNVNLVKLARSYGLAQIPSISFSGEDSEEESEDEVVQQKGSKKLIIQSTAEKSGEDKTRTKSQKKLDKLKKKIEEKKSTGGVAAEPMDDELDTEEVDQAQAKNALHNSKRFKKEMKRAKVIDSDEENEDDELLLVKRKDHQIKVEDMVTNPWKLSNKQLKKVHTDGHFQGKNIFEIPDDDKSNPI